jgi:hypothetical protein
LQPQRSWHSPSIPRRRIPRRVNIRKVHKASIRKVHKVDIHKVHKVNIHKVVSSHKPTPGQWMNRAEP